MKKYFLISGFSINDNNRGTAALGYGAIYFMREKNFCKEGQKLLQIQYVKKFWERKYRNRLESLQIQGQEVLIKRIFVFELEKRLFDVFGLLFPWTSFGKAIRQVSLVAAINGGDGFSDIYGTETFLMRLSDTKIAMKRKIPLILLPQTLGPFTNKENYNLAERILRYAKKVYIRDKQFTQNLITMGVNYEKTKDLSAYMQTEPWGIDIEQGSIGLNVSGLAYSNQFRSLSGEFENYPELIERIIEFFQRKNRKIYLIPHSYNYNKPENNNDDMVACRLAYNRLRDKKNVILVDKELTSPQVKFLISKMSFFIGTRMHANFAAIYTNVPLFGLAYSYKFKGAFDANGLDGDMQTSMINNITLEDIDKKVNKIGSVYNKLVKRV